MNNCLSVEPIQLSPNFCADWQPNKSYTNTTEINGISISPKKGFCIIKIWNNNSKNSDTKFIVNTIPYIVNEESIYKAFSENKN